MQEREVSQGDWRRVMGTGLREEVEGFLRSEAQVDVGKGKVMTVREFYGAKVGEDAGRYVGVEDDEYPMIYVDWDGAHAYCRELTEKEQRAGRLGEGWKYELPTEAQWEYACRAGSKEAVYGGEMRILGKNNAPVLDRIAWYGGNSAVGYPGSGIYFRGDILSSASWPGMAYAGGVCGPRRCGVKAGNLWGLKDMMGNVLEWCGDWYDSYRCSLTAVVTDPDGPASGVRRVFRGGSWSSNAVECRSGYRSGFILGNRGNDLGFRPALISPHPVISQPPAFELRQSPRAMEATVARASSGYGLERISQNYDPRVTYQKFSPAQLNEVESLMRSDNLCKSADAEMEAVYIRMRSNFGQNAAKKDSLKADQLNWLYFRTSVLNSVPISLRSTVFVQLTRERVNYLRVW